MALLRKIISLNLVVVILAISAAAKDSLLTFDTQICAWWEVGQVVKSSNKSTKDFDHQWHQQFGAFLRTDIGLGEHIAAHAGLGTQLWHFSYATNAEALWGRQNLTPFLTDAYLTAATSMELKPKLRLDVGYFPYKYNRHIQNLGLYLLRGPVYPGYLFSGFETPETLPLASHLGIRLHSTLFDFWGHDLILKSETAIKPYYDYSLAYITDIDVAKTLEIGAGVYFYRLLSVNENLTTPGGSDDINEVSDPDTPYERYFTYVDTVTNDTTVLTHRGIKLMARLAFDPKGLFNSEIFGKNDLILYTEGAVIGVKDYPFFYDNIAKRIPVMAGFNLPTFGLLDVLAFEIEYYNSDYVNDYINVVTKGAPVPLKYDESFGYQHNPRGDDWKWSVYARGIIKDRIIISGQVANDHYRLPITYTQAGEIHETPEEVCAAAGDWNWALKLAFLF